MVFSKRVIDDGQANRLVLPIHCAATAERTRFGAKRDADNPFVTILA